MHDYDPNAPLTKTPPPVDPAATLAAPPAPSEKIADLAAGIASLAGFPDAPTEGALAPERPEDAEQIARGLVGKTIKGRYTLWEIIGSGLQGSAYLAYDNLLEGKVVVKVLSSEFEGIPLPLPEGWEQEAKKAFVVRNCPYIASVTDFGQEAIETDDGLRETAFIVWEYVKGQTLEDVTSEGTELTLEFLLEVTQQLIQVLRILQANNLIHGDLHSKNVMVDRESSGKPLVKVIDFGLSHTREAGRAAWRDLRSVQRIGQHLVELRRAQLGPTGLSAKDQEFAAILDQMAVERNEDIEEAIRRALAAMDGLARRLLSTPASLGSYETLDELFAGPHRILAESTLNRAVPCIGRSEAIQQVGSHLGHALADGHGAAVMLRGEEGVGKKRLAWEALWELSRAHPELFILCGRGHRGNESSPFGVIRELLRDFLGEEREAEYARLLGMLLPDSQALVGPLAEFLQEERPGGKAAELPTAAMANVIAKALAKFSLIRPVVVWISDLQFVDEPSRQALLQVASHAQRFPLALIGTHTPGELAAGGQQALFETWHAQLAALGHYTDIPVRSLTRPQVAEYLRVALPWPSLDEQAPLVQALWQHSGGNPHFLQESMAYLRQAEILRPLTDGSWEVDTPALTEVGATSIQLLLERRVQQLDPLTREVLEQAACWGVEFPALPVAQLFGINADEALLSLGAVEEQGLLTRSRGELLAFQPYALWEHLIGIMPDERRRRYHRNVAEALQSDPTSEEGHEAALAIARHWREGGDSQQSLVYALLAAERALVARANEIALEACHLAQGILIGAAVTHPDASKLLAQCYLYQAKAYRYLGDQAAQEEYAYKAYEASVVARDHPLEMRALKALGEYYRSISDYTSSTDYFREGMELAEKSGDRSRLARFYKETGVNNYLQGDLQAARDDYEAAIKINEELGDAEGLARVYNNQGVICRNKGEWADAKAWFEKSIAYFQEAGESRGAILPTGNMAIIHTEEGEYEKAMILLKELLRDESQLGESRIQAKVRVTLGNVQLEIGQYAEALGNYEQSLTVYRALGDRQGECEVLTAIAMVYFEEGKLDLADRFHSMAMELKREIGYEWGIAYDHYDLARVAIIRGELEGADEQIRVGDGIAQRLGMTEMEFSFDVLQAKLMELSGRETSKELARRYDDLWVLYPEVQPHMTKQRQLIFLVQAGRFYRDHGEPESGESMLNDARALLKQLDRRLFRREHKLKFRAKYQRLFPDLGFG